MIVPIVKRGDACSFHRIEMPFKYAGLWKEEFETETLESLISKASVVLFSRVWDKDIIELLTLKKKYGFKLVADVDDFWELPREHIAYRGWVSWNMEQRTKESILNSDMVLTTTNRLADIISPLNSNVEVIPNALPFDEGQFLDNRVIGDKVRFMSAGGNSHLRDLRQITNCLRKLERTVWNQYETVLAGYDNQDKMTWNAMESIVGGYRSTNYTRVHRYPLDSYMDAFNAGDVVLAPLEPNHFNKFKSNLRILEAGCKRMPIICSNWPPYADEPADLIRRCQGTNGWYSSMLEFIKNPQLVTDEGNLLGEYVRSNYNLHKVNLHRLEILNYLAQKT